MADPRHELGGAAERAALTWLESCGWRLLRRRYRSAAGGEIDLVMLDPKGVLVGIEVRARRSERTGSAVESVDRRHVRRMSRTLVAFAAEAAPTRELRIDLVTAAPAANDQVGSWLLHRMPAVDAA